MNEKIEKLVKEYEQTVENHDFDISEILKEAILYGRTSALDEVEEGLPERSLLPFESMELKNWKKGFNEYQEIGQNLISRIRSETSG